MSSAHSPRPTGAPPGPDRRAGRWACVSVLALSAWSAWLPPAQAAGDGAPSGAAVAPGHFAGTGCPYIRPPALHRDAIHRLVLDRLALALGRQLDQLRTDQSFAEQLPAGQNAASRFRYAALAIGEALGFDAPARFAEAHQARQGTGGPERSLSLRHLQALSLNAYQEGSDALPPPADAAAVYRLDGIQVRAPRPEASGSRWSLMRCGHDQVAYWRSGPGDSGSSTAVVRLTALPQWQGEAALVAHLRGVLRQTVPEGYTLNSLSVEPVAGAGRCAQARLTARDGEQPFRLRARFCYASAEAQYGPTVLFSQSGAGDEAAFEAAAEAFLAQQAMRIASR